MDELLDLERRFWTAASIDLYRAHAAPDLLLVFPEPTGVLDLEAALPLVEAAGPWAEVELENVHVVEVAADAVALAYRATGTRGADTYETLATSVHARRGGRWLLVLHQQTPLD